VARVGVVLRSDLDCALAVFARKDFHETSIAAICARARIARGRLYQARRRWACGVRAARDRASPDRGLVECASARPGPSGRGPRLV